jgi:hypothetical protein
VYACTFLYDTPPLIEISSPNLYYPSFRVIEIDIRCTKLIALFFFLPLAIHTHPHHGLVHTIFPPHLDILYKVVKQKVL